MRKEDTVSFLSHFLNVRAAPLLDSFRDWTRVHDANIVRSNFYPKADHLSYKCREVREYDELRSRFEEYTDGWRGCRFFHQSVISGRRVAAIGLVDGLPTPFGALRVLELSEPKPMSADQGGFDHIEICPGLSIPSASAEFMAASMNHRSKQLGLFVKKARPHHTTWDAVITSDGRPGRQDFILRITSEPLVAKIGREML